MLGIDSFSFLFNLPTGKINPALAEAERLLVASAVFPNLADLPNLPDFADLSGLESTFILFLELVATKGVTGLETLDVLAAGTVAATAGGLEGATGNVTGGKTGAGGLLSNSVSGTLDTVNAIEELV